MKDISKIKSLKEITLKSTWRDLKKYVLTIELRKILPNNIGISAIHVVSLAVMDAVQYVQEDATKAIM